LLSPNANPLTLTLTLSTFAGIARPALVLPYGAAPRRPSLIFVSSVSPM
jgi:hypothetical protein